jgi:shikimate dehydrogenase
LETVTGGLEPSRVLLLGSGASSRSVALAVSRRWPRCAVQVAARRPEAAAELLSSIGGVVEAEGSLARPWPLVINTTTWGETEASEAEPFGVDLDGVFVPGGRLFDLNNRISALQHQALEAGCAVLSGTVMQRVTNASRAALLVYSAL